MGRTLQIYVFKRTVMMTIWFALGVGALAFLIDFSELQNRVSNLPGYSAMAALGMSAMRVPFIVQVALPFMILFATMATLMQMNRKYELVVARSVGVSAWQFLFPTWLAAFVIGLFAVFVLNPLSAEGFTRALLAENSLVPGRAASGSGTEPWMRQSTGDGRSMLIGARTAVAGGATLLDPVFIMIDADGNVTERHDARRAQLNGDSWRLADVRTSRIGVPPLEEKSITLPTTASATAVADAFMPSELIPLWELVDQVGIAAEEGNAALPFRMQLHSLIAKPMLFVAMTLIAATVSLRFVRFGQSAGMILGGITAGFVLYVVTELTRSFGSAGILPPVVAAWLPVAAAALFGIAYLLHREDG